MPEFVFTMHNVRKTMGEKLILDNVTLSFFEGAKIGVVGPNGAGKSTMLKIMAGLEKPNNGEAMLKKGASVGILLQEPPLTEGKTVMENIEEAVAETKAMLDRFNEIGLEMAEPDADFDSLMEEMGNLQTELDVRDAWDLDSQLQQAMNALQCPPPDTPVDVLSGGERRRVALCKLLLEQPDLLLLDEPTNHLDAESVARLEGHLKNTRAVRDHPRPILPGQRRGGSARSTAAAAPTGQLLHLPRDRRSCPRSRARRQVRQDLERELEVRPTRRHPAKNRARLARMRVKAG